VAYGNPCPNCSALVLETVQPQPRASLHNIRVGVTEATGIKVQHPNYPHLPRSRAHRARVTACRDLGRRWTTSRRVLPGPGRRDFDCHSIDTSDSVDWGVRGWPILGGQPNWREGGARGSVDPMRIHIMRRLSYALYTMKLCSADRRRLNKCMSGTGFPAKREPPGRGKRKLSMGLGLGRHDRSLPGRIASIPHIAPLRFVSLSLFVSPPFARISRAW
jgi:hypothetical protein